MTYRTFITTLLTFALIPAAAQRAWTLDECIDYAIAHNTQILQAKLQVEDAEIQLHTSRHSRLPSLNASMNQSFGFGRSQGRDGSTEDVTSGNTSFSLGTSVPLFTAMRIPNQIRANRESLQAAEQRLEAERRQIGIAITGYYLNAVYYKGVSDVAREQVALDSMRVATARAMVAEGRRAESEVFEAEAALSSSRLELSTADGNLALALLDLRQALNYEETDATPIPAPVTSSETDALASKYLASPSWMSAGLEAHPTLQAGRHQLRASEYALRVAKASYYPTLDFSAGYSNSYFHSYDYDNQSLARQLRLNGSEYLGLSLSIPIFNRFSVRNNVRRAKLNTESISLQLDETRRTLRKQMEQAQVNAINARNRLQSALQAERANETACRYEREKYAAGRSTIYTLSQAEQKLVSARNSVVQAQCELALRLHILKYYDI